MHRASAVIGGLGVLLVSVFFFGWLWSACGTVGKLGIFQNEADRAQAHAGAVAAGHQLAEDLRWLPWKTAAVSLLLICVCLAIGLFAVGGAIGFLGKRVQEAQVVWPRAGVLPVPRVRIMKPGDQADLPAKAIEEYWSTERANAQRPLPPVRQDVHITGATKDEAAAALEAHHEAPSFKVLAEQGHYGEEAR